MNIFRKRESKEETQKRVMKLAKNVECGLMQPPMKAQDALNELARHLLGSNYYVVDPVNSEQTNTQIVYDIERKYKRME